ncbi:MULTISPECIES: hypothetical protein [Actinoalloteichus]|uniref:PE domain-containing protein n=1 Tax=Actinoalloteichus fjordicus TaxID=1612552 RepID=A0AAC9L9N8_9PSEU|nr:MULTISPECIES: hypothetical protein [Actinoalloteichus]APU12359.1 hypothetical protein UA74_01345 [Actinoalloteichus fjordicus]APU18311.1 hypothetical protein UA75_01345 [Actinoalloteichus sp. GBA129-24]
MSGTFELDPERLPQAIADLEEARSRIIDIAQEARELGLETPNQGSDGVSSNAGLQISRVAGGQDGALFNANEAYLEALNATIDNFKAMLADYHSVEDANQLGLQNIDAAEFSVSETPSERREREFYENNPHIPPGARG